jgi:hypothetical protein
MSPLPINSANAELQQILARAQHGDLSVLPELRRHLDDNQQLWEHFGNLAAQAEGALVKLAAGNDLLLAESLIRKQYALKAELAGDSPGPVEKALAERAAICSLQIAYFDALSAQTKGASVQQMDSIRKHQDSANRRYLAALKTLAVVKKLLRPSPSPIQIANGMQSKRRPAVLEREKMLTNGMAIQN